MEGVRLTEPTVGDRLDQSVGDRLGQAVGDRLDQAVGDRLDQAVGMPLIDCNSDSRTDKPHTDDSRSDVVFETYGPEKSDHLGYKDTSEGGRKKGIVSVLKGNLLLILTMCGVVLGFGLGFVLRSVSMSESANMWLGLPGDLFMRAIYCTILPLIVSSVITGTASTDSRWNSRIYTITTVYIASVNITGIVVGLVVYYIVLPSRFVSIDDEVTRASRDLTRLETQDIISDLIRNFVPNNIISACIEKVQTQYMGEKVLDETNMTSVRYVRQIGSASGTNVLGLIVVSAVVGLASTKIQHSNDTFIQFFTITADIVITIMKWLVWLTPIGVLSLIATAVAKIENLDESVKSCGMFILTVMVQNIILYFIIIPAVYFVCERKNPLFYLHSVTRATMAAIAAPSSIMAIPDLLTAAEVKHGVKVDISRFTISFGVALCRMGSAAFIVSSVLFLQHLEGMEVGWGQVLYAVVLTFVGTLALPSVPSGSIVCILIILSSLDVTPSNIGMLMAMEWLLDRTRTMSNVNAMLLGAIVLERFD